MNARKSKGRWTSGGVAGLWYVLALGCTSERPIPPDESDTGDRTSDASRVDSTSSARFERPSDSAQAADAAVSFTLEFDAAPSAERFDAASDVGATSSPETDTQRIEQPTIQRVSFEELCADVAAFEGTVFDVDLTNSGRLGEWVEVARRDVFPDSGVERSLDAGSEAGTCLTRFAPYELPCRGSVLVATAPTHVFGAGPVIGGETVGLGCWEARCDSGCAPSALDTLEIGLVRARVVAVVDARFDEALMTYVGDVRVNGATLKAIAGLEILERR